MARVRNKDTRPEKLVRSIIHALGIRFRLHAKELPGRPDIVFRPRKMAIFVHGCYWHRHAGCRYATSPKTREDFWNQKFAANEVRDNKVQDQLAEMGWSVEIVWECETKNFELLSDRLKLLLKSQT